MKYLPTVKTGKGTDGLKTRESGVLLAHYSLEIEGWVVLVLIWLVAFKDAEVNDSTDSCSTHVRSVS